MKKFFVSLLMVIGLGALILTNNGTEAQADTIPQPTSIEKLFPDTALAEMMRDALGKSSVTDTVSQNELNQLTFLQADQKDLESIEGLQYVNNLNHLSLSGTKISNINNLSDLTKLELLNLSANQINDISPLSELTNLRHLNLYSNKISDVSSLVNLTNLDFLNLYNNQINDVKALSKLTNLTNLYLDNNQLFDISPLSSLTKLENLNLNNNQISDISKLSGLTNLRYLDLGHNQINDISTLSSLTNLISVELRNQQITFEPRTFQNVLIIPNIVVDNTKAIVPPNTISNNGTYIYPNVKWNLANFINDVSYTFNQSVTIGNANGVFAGTVSQPLLEPTSYTVTFDVDGKQSSEQSSDGVLITEPTAPTKEGYTFNGWYDKKTGGEEWDFEIDKMPPNDITLYAQFSINDYTATFDVDGKTTNQTVNYQDLLTEPIPPTKEGYKFIGWYDAKTNGTKWEFNIDKMPAKNITLYAQFIKQANPNNNKKTPGQGRGNTTSNSSILIKSKTPTASNIKLPKTGDETNNLPTSIGFLCIGVIALLGFSRIQKK
ncbi:TPA: InlB B-repeat-containing protein [Listeria monocytogenes]|uniref:InlB B-repeat-containing protein n=1 Tax=Listeria monocytogenes TaxID=1639 RepID=UPI00074D676E|nr:InlB B-repeat-containing protein [Listeria monocytogenes]EEO9456043.1 LPXTG cell wall anchor domain-containing protein [Listeria monocytogenes]EHD0445835.1 LPXTG cell wall anchor domain-containing protein [Listeria monocytogenes]CUL76068.1 Internalin C2 [Listeria monocytogenes]HAA3140074.1 internalin [Listeria monocytogenes]HAA4151537.1 internalin [Listeria monocytogenes]